MLVSNTPRPSRLLSAFGRPLLLLSIWDTFTVVAFKVLHWQWIAYSGMPLALYGSVIGIVLGFRNNSAYSRWWEARTLWGQIVNCSRSLARQICTTAAEDAEAGELKRSVVHYQIAFVHALKQQLRGVDPIKPLTGLIPDREVSQLRAERNVPFALQQRISTVLREARQRGLLNCWEWQAMDRTLCELMNAQGGAERIKNTPLPKQYDFFVMLFVQVYCILLPIGMVESLGWLTPLGSTMVGFMFLALDRIGRSLEDPFDNTVYDVPLGAISTSIEMNLRQALGEPYAQPPTPVQGVLW